MNYSCGKIKLGGRPYNVVELFAGAGGFSSMRIFCLGKVMINNAPF